MYEGRISTADSQPVSTIDGVETLRGTLARLQDFAIAAKTDHAPQYAGGKASVALRYAAAAPIVRRRVDALMQEAQTIATAGMRLVAQRRDGADAAGAAAAHFLGNSLDAILRKVDMTLSPRAA